MSKTAFVSAVALAAMLGLSAPTFAQDMQHIIGGNAVPADQIEAVQAKCDELRAAGSADAAATTDTTTGADATAGASTAAETATDAAGAAATTGTDAAGTTTTETDAAASTDAAMEVEVDLDTLTIEMCDEGGFTASAM